MSVPNLRNLYLPYLEQRPDAAMLIEHGQAISYRDFDAAVGRISAELIAPYPPGIPLLILSTERDRVVAARGRKLGVETLHGVADKAAVLATWLAEHDLDAARVAYVGNDVNDLAAMATVGWPLAVADAHPAVRAAARHVLTSEGGNGAVREACDLVLAALPRASTSAPVRRAPLSV